MRSRPSSAAYARLARACTLLDRAAEADRNYQLALSHYDRAGDRDGQSGVHHELAILTAANLAATVMRFLALRLWVFRTRAAHVA